MRGRKFPTKSQGKLFEPNLLPVVLLEFVSRMGNSKRQNVATKSRTRASSCLTISFLEVGRLSTLKASGQVGQIIRKRWIRGRTARKNNFGSMEHAIDVF